MFRIAALVAVTAALSPLNAQRVVVTHKSAGTVGIYDPATGRELFHHPTGHGPHEVATSADGRWVVVTDYGAQVPGSTLTILDLRDSLPVRTVELPERRPHGVKVLSDNRTAVITAEQGGKLLLVDVAAGEVVTTLPTGQRLSHMVAVSPDERQFYTANISDGTLSIIPRDGGDPAIVRVGTMTEAIAASPDGRTVWLGSNNTGKVFVVDVERRAVIDSVQTPGFPYRIAFTPDGRIAIVTNPQQDEVRLIDARSREVMTVIGTATPGGPAQPFGVIVAPDGKRAWFTMAMSGEVMEVELPSGRVVGRFPVGAGTGPDGIALLP